MTTIPKPSTCVTSTTTPAPQQPVFNTRYLLYAFNQSGYHINEFAYRLDLSARTLEALLRGNDDPGELRIATLVAMANQLGIPLHSMFARPEPLPDPANATDPAPTKPGTSTAADAETQGTDDLKNDAEQLLACIYEAGRTTPTLVSEIAKAFGWTIERTYAAANESDRRLAPAGLTMKTNHGNVFVAPINDHLDAQTALKNHKVYARGLHINQYRTIHQILTGRKASESRSTARGLINLGAMVNLGVLTQAKKPALTEATREAFL